MTLVLTRTAAALAAAAFIAAPCLAAADLVLDDFTTGLVRSTQVKSGTLITHQTGARIVGGSRAVALSMCDPVDCGTLNPYNLGMSFAVAKSRDPARPAALIQNSPVFTGGRFEVDYGAEPAVLDLDFSAFDRLRIDFQGLTETLNFNVQIFDNSGFKYLQGGCNAAAYNSSFSLELPFDRMLAPAGPIDLHHVVAVVLIFQSSSAIGGVEFAVNRVSASATSQALAVTCAYSNS